MSTTLADLIDVIESGYEFLLAYAAQGRLSDDAGDSNSEVRQTLENMHAAAGRIASMLESTEREFAGIVIDDIRKARAAIDLVTAQPAIGSELVDNLNVSVHLRSLLTDLFLLSEAEL